MKKHNFKVLVFLRKNDNYSKKFLNFLKKKFKKVCVLYSEDKNKKIFLKKLHNWKGNYIFSFRNKFILKKKIIRKADILAINFHPGPPKYRGIGCLNFALINGEKKYGVTSHIINQKIDNGKILKVIYFPISSRESLKKILIKTHKSLFRLSIQVINQILKKKFKKNKYRWSKKLYKLKDLNNLYNLNISLKKYDIKQVLRATLINNYKPFIKLNKKKFFISK